MNEQTLPAFSKHKVSLKKQINSYVEGDEKRLIRTLIEAKGKVDSNNSKEQVHNCIKNFNSYINSLDRALEIYAIQKETSYLNRYHELVDSKTKEFDEINNKMNEAFLQALSTHEVKKSRLEISELKKRIRSLTVFCEESDAKCKKYKVQMSYLEDENKFLRGKFKTLINENNVLHVRIKSFIKDLSQVLVKLPEFITVKEKCVEFTSLLNELMQPLLGLGKESLLEFVLNSSVIIEDSKRQVKKLSSDDANKLQTSPKVDCFTEEGYKQRIKILTERKRVLEKQVLHLKAKLGSSVYKRNDLEGIFTNCVEATRNQILKRRFKISNKDDREEKLLLTKDIANTLKKAKGSIKLTEEDKMNMLTLFVCNEQLVKHIYDFIFPKQEDYFTIDTSLLVKKRLRNSSLYNKSIFEPTAINLSAQNLYGN